MFKKYSEESLPPLIFHPLSSTTGAPVSLRYGEYAGFRGDSVQGVQSTPQVGKGQGARGQEQSWGHAQLVSELFHFAPRTRPPQSVCTVLRKP